MKTVFLYTPNHQYSFGCVIVAADSREEADQFVKAKHPYMAIKASCQVIKGMTYEGDSDIIVDNYGEE